MPLLGTPKTTKKDNQPWESSTWAALMHYKKQGLQTAYVSDVESEAFFLSSQGKEDPEKEYTANLEQALRMKEYACRFPARFEFLQQHSSILAGRTEPLCPARDAWLADYQGFEMTLVFPAQDVSQPVSTFGHLFLKVGRPEAFLNAQTLAFTADVGAPGAFEYVYQGLTGGFLGTFKLMPLHQALRNYLMVEGRDVWEYPIPLSKEERAFWLKHLWELKDIQARYYFTSKNCAYQVIESLRVMRPEAFPDEVDAALLPTEALQLVERIFGLGAPSVSTSLNRRLQWYSRQLPLSRRWALKRLLDEPQAFNAEAPKLSDWEWHYLSTWVQRERQDWNQHRAKLAELQQQFGTLTRYGKDRSPVPEAEMQPMNPLKAHAPQRLSLFAHGQALELGSRFLYHSAEDPSAGFDTGVDVELLGAQVQLAPSFTPSGIQWVNIARRAPNDEALAWQVDLSWISAEVSSAPKGTQSFLGTGLSLGKRPLHMYTLFGLGRLAGYAWVEPLVRIGAFSAWGFRGINSWRSTLEVTANFKGEAKAEGGIFWSASNAISLGIGGSWAYIERRRQDQLFALVHVYW